jgi:hypothetical protein
VLPSHTEYPSSLTQTTFAQARGLIDFFRGDPGSAVDFAIM